MSCNRFFVSFHLTHIEDYSASPSNTLSRSPVSRKRTTFIATELPSVDKYCRYVHSFRLRIDLRITGHHDPLERYPIVHIGAPVRPSRDTQSFMRTIHEQNKPLLEVDLPVKMSPRCLIAIHLLDDSAKNDRRLKSWRQDSYFIIFCRFLFV